MSARRRATYDDILALPEHLVGQILDGELIVHPRPSLEHGRAASAIDRRIGGPFGGDGSGPGGWWILVEPELHFGQEILVPDLAGWRRERMPNPPRGPFAEVPPDWVCEILSPSTAALDRVRKLPKYARVDVAHAWVVDPAARSLEVFRRSPEGQWIIVAAHAGDEKVRAEPFDAIELDLSALWLPDEKTA